MNRRLWILGILVALLAIFGGLVLWRSWTSQPNEDNLQQQQLDTVQAAREAWFASGNRSVLFLSANSNTSLYGVDAYTRDTIQLSDTVPTIFSNYLPASQHWYSVENTTVTQHAATGSTVVGSLTQLAVPTDSTGLSPAIAVDTSERYMAWLSRTDYTESVHLLDLTTGGSTELYQGEPNVHYGNFTFSPNSSELAFTANDTKIITLTMEGAEIHTPVSIPFHQFHSLTWLSLNEFGAVISSTDANPEPFSPTVIVMDRDGSITERHDVFEKIGTPRVVWSADATQFMFQHPWRNTFYVYNRYDELQQQITASAPGKLIPFGYVDGNAITAGATDSNIPSNETDPNTSDNTTEPFVTTAEDWEHYNQVERAIVQQWPIDLNSYRFTTDEHGLYLSFAYDASIVAEPVQLVFIQTLLQTFAVLPDIPAMTLIITNPQGDVIWKVEQLSVETASSAVDSLVHMPIEQLFIINKRNPIGIRTPKPENSNYHYLGDLVYSKFGDYNPNLILALLGASTLQQQYYSNSTYTILLPDAMSTKTISDNELLLYTAETEFVSTTAWNTFGISIRSFDAPGITLDQWLSVNRPDQLAELPTFTPYEPEEVKHIVTDDAYTDEYVVLIQNTVYVLTLQRDSGITDVDQALFNSIVQSISFFYAIQR